MEKVEVIKRVDKTKEHQHTSVVAKDPESKVYLLCLASNDGGDNTWELIVGRTELYKTIKDMIETIDFEKSFVLVESAKLCDRRSIVKFMKYAEQFYNDSFDIDDYIKGDWDENEYQMNNEIDGMLTAFTENRLDMKTFMDGDIKTSSLGQDE